MALAAWLLVLHRATGHWLGNAEFAQYNVAGALRPLQILYSAAERAFYLFVKEGRFIGVIALYVGWRLLRGSATGAARTSKPAQEPVAPRLFPRRDWAMAALVAGAQLAVVTLLGGAVLDRYLLPVLPILYAAFATAASAYPAAWRWTSHTALIAVLLLSWVWNPPYPFQYEDNLAMVDFVELQRSAAEFLEINAPTRRIASMWPFTGAIGNPEFGYVERPLRPVSLQSFHARPISPIWTRAPSTFWWCIRASTRWKEAGWTSRRSTPCFAGCRAIIPRRRNDELSESGFLSLARWERHGQWIEVYAPDTRP